MDTSPSGSDTDPTTEAVEREFPRWHCWRGISGLVYASRQKTSPPLILRDENTVELRAQIRVTEDKLADESTFRWPRDTR